MIKGNWGHVQKGRPPKRGMMAVLEFVRSEVAAGRGFPRHKAIQTHMEWKHSTSVNDSLARLADRGYITMTRREPSYRGFKYYYALPETEDA